MALFLKEYEKLRNLGKGSFAKVYKVKHEKLGYIRAIKVSNEIIDDENDRGYQTFLNECRTLLKIGNGCHHNIVRIYQPRMIDNRAMVEMDYVEGITLLEYLKREKFINYPEVIRFIKDVVGAMAYCHVDIYKFLMNPETDHLTPDPNDGRKYLIDADKEQELINEYGVTHNDLHSNNVMRRDYDGSYVLLDFGLSVQNGSCVKSSSRGDGAYEYCSPEKLERSEVSMQSDVYSLGILIYEVLAGRVPFPLEIDDSHSIESAKYRVFQQHLSSVPPEIEPLRRKAFETANPGERYKRDYPEWLDDVIMKCLAKKPADRYHNAKQLLTDINAHLEEDSRNEAVASIALRSEINRHIQTIDDLNKSIEKYITENNILKERLSQKPNSGMTEKRKKPSGLSTATWIESILLIAAIIFAGLLWIGKENDAIYFRERIKSLETQLRQNRVPDDPYQAINDTITYNNDTTEQYADSLTQYINDLRSEVEALQDEYTILDKENYHLRNNNHILQSENSSLRTENKRLQGQVDRFIQNFGQ